MKYNPCIDECTSEGSHCSGCGRSHEEIAATKQLVKSIVEFIQQQDYENPEEFLARISKSVLRKL
ncbi:MAG: DUF1289 domain-containing protein [Methylomonas sp.]|jgi:predicted Fe-S protein YdhL (DUF1289 family)